MKINSASILFSISLLSTTQLLAHSGGIVQSGSGSDISSGLGGCVYFGEHTSGICNPELEKEVTAAAAMKKAEPEPAPMVESELAPMVEPEPIPMAEPESIPMAEPQPAPVAKAEPVVKKVINLSGVTFKTNSNELKSTSFLQLGESVSELKDNPDVNVIVAGHTDSAGDDLYNQNLSEKRAQAVREYMIGKGIDGSRLTASGFGESEPVASNETKAGRASNRRVELRILE